MHSGHVQGHSPPHCSGTRQHRIVPVIKELEAKLGIHDIRHHVHSRALRYLGYVFRMDADRIPIIPSLLQRCWVVALAVDGNLKQHSVLKPSLRTFTIPSKRKLLGELGLSLLDAANKGEWHNITKTRGACCARGIH
jgi:hypothetical protein